MRVAVAAAVAVAVAVAATLASAEEEHIEWTPFDGWFNNLAHPEWGAVDSPLTRRCPSFYADGTYAPSGENRPNPRTITRHTMGGVSGMGSHTGKTALMVFFGQQVVEEVLDAQRQGNPPEYFNIPIEPGDPLYDPDNRTAEGERMFIPVLRTRYAQDTGHNPGVPRQQLNEITPWLDGGLMYGFARAWADTLRSFKGGRMACLNEGTEDENCNFPQMNHVGLPMANPPPPSSHTLRPVNRFWMLGNPRGLENPALLSMGVLWFRLHNFWADKIKAMHEDYTDERIFFTARQIVIGIHQQLTYYDWLPVFLGITREELPEYKGYSSSTFPGITQEFQSAAMRFGHTMVTPGLYRRKPESCEFIATTPRSGDQTTGNLAVRTCNHYFEPQPAHEEVGDVAHMVLGLASQIAEREDNVITEDLHGFVFGPLEASRRDLMALNIQRARDHGLGTYNDARICYGLEPIESFEDIFNGTNLDPRFGGCTDEGGNEVNCMQMALDGMRRVYNDPENPGTDRIEQLDIWVGGLMETTTTGPGELFSTIILDQFTRIRDADRFWFENKLAPSYNLIREYVPNISTLSFRQVIIDAFGLDPDNTLLQENVFRIEGAECQQPEQLKAGSNVEDCTSPKTFDFYLGKTPRSSDASPSAGSRMAISADSPMACPFAKEQIRMVRNHIMSTFRPGALQGTDDLGQTNFSSRTQLVIVLVAVFAYVFINVGAMYLYTYYKEKSKNPAANKTRDPPPSGSNRAGGYFEYGVIVLDNPPVPKMIRNSGEGGRLSVQQDFIQIDQDSGKYVLRFELSRVTLFQYWNNFATIVLEPYSFDPDIKVWTCLKFEESGTSRMDFQNALLQKQPHGIVVQEVMTIADLGHPQGTYVNFELRRQEVEAIFAGAALQAISSKDEEKRAPEENQLQNLGFQVTQSFMNRAQFVAGGYKGATTPGVMTPTVSRGVTPSPSPRFVSTVRPQTPMSPMSATNAQMEDEEQPSFNAVPPMASMSENIEKMGRLRQASRAEVGRLKTDLSIRQSILSQLAAQQPSSVSSKPPNPSGRLLSMQKSLSSFSRDRARQKKVSPSAALPDFQFNEETLRTFATRPEVSLTEFAEIFKLPSSSFIVRRIFSSFCSRSDDVMGFKDLSRGLSVLLGWEFDRASVIAGFFAGNRDMVDEEEVTRIVKELVNLSGAGSEASVNPIVEAIFQHVPPPSTLNRRSRAVPKAELEQVIMSNSALLRGEAVDERLCWDLLDSSRDQAMEDKRSGHLWTWFSRVRSWHQTHALEIFWLVFYFLLVSLIFGERFYNYAIERETAGLRRILDWGVSFTRGAASVQAFAYSVVLLPMCRHIITILRGTVLHRYVPFDKAYEFHVIVGMTGAVGTFIHVLGHFFNFQHIASQTASDLGAIFRSVWWQSDFLPTFAWWLFSTVTGFSGVVLTFVCITLFTFAVKRVRRASFQLFWVIHHLMFVLLYIGSIVHGSFQLIQQPLWHWFFIWPLSAFVLDKLIGVAQVSRYLQVKEAKILPSGTVALYIEKPMNLMYQSGQYARIQIRQLGTREFHPFTISSAPFEKYVSYHIQPVGPWTKKLKEFVAEYESGEVKRLPRARMDGPYGDGFESWSSYESILLVGGGIGLTPFMSMLKDIAHQMRLDTLNARTKKIYCVFVLRKLKEFDWLAELMREVEDALGESGMLEVIFYATATKANDFRSVFLEYFEETSQLFAARSALTNTRGYTIFGRPDFSKLLMKISGKELARQKTVGVYTCGPPPMTGSLNTAVRDFNERRIKMGDSDCCTFKHFYQNFG